MTLIFGNYQYPEPPPLDPPDKPRVWYQAVFKYMTPNKARLTPEQANEVILANWDRSWNDIKRNGVALED